MNGGLTFEPNMLVTDSGGVVWRNLVSYSDESSSDNRNFNGNQYGDYGGVVANRVAEGGDWACTGQTSFSRPDGRRCSGATRASI